MDLSAVVVNWNSGVHLRRLIKSLEDVELERLLVVDNASTDDSLKGVTERTEVEIISNASNLGFAVAANQGIERIETPYLFLLNPDVEIDGSTVDSLVDAIRGRPSVALVCPTLVDKATGQTQFTFQISSLPSLRGVIADALFLEELVDRLRGSTPAPDWNERESVEVEQPAAACWLMRRQAWADLGGFDERFTPAWFEDVDFCRRLAQSGWRCLLVPGVRAQHQGGYSVEALGRAHFTRIYYDNLLRYWHKHHRATYPLVWPAVRLGVLIRRLGVGR